MITTLAGNGQPGFGSSNGDTGPATQAQLNPMGVAVGPDGSRYIAEPAHRRVRRVDSRGIVTTVAGTGQAGFAGDGGPATQALLGNDSPRGIAVGADGGLYIADSGNHRVRRVDPRGIITTVAGSGQFGFGGDGGPATKAQLLGPTGVAAAADGSLYIADTGNRRVRRVDPRGVIATVAGTGQAGFSGDGRPATQAQLVNPLGVAVSADGSLYISDASSNTTTGNNHRVRRVDQQGIITTVAGTGELGFGGDGGPATQALLNFPTGVVVAADGSLYIADTGNNRVRRLDHPGGIISTVAGTGQAGFGGDGGPATAALLNCFASDRPGGVAVAADGSLYVGDSSNNRVRRVDAGGIITTVAGTGQNARDVSDGDGGPAAQARLNPSGAAVAADGSLFILDNGNSRVRRVDAGGTISTVAGTGEPGFSGDGGPAIQAQLNSPEGLVVNPDGSLYIADTGNNRVRRIDPGGTITTVAGNGQPGFVGAPGDGGPATQAPLSNPRGIVFAPDGSLYMADTGSVGCGGLTRTASSAPWPATELALAVTEVRPPRLSLALSEGLLEELMAAST